MISAEEHVEVVRPQDEHVNWSTQSATGFVALGSKPFRRPGAAVRREDFDVFRILEIRYFHLVNGFVAVLVMGQAEVGWFQVAMHVAVSVQKGNAFRWLAEYFYSS